MMNFQEVFGNGCANHPQTRHLSAWHLIDTLRFLLGAHFYRQPPITWDLMQARYAPSCSRGTFRFGRSWDDPPGVMVRDNFDSLTKPHYPEKKSEDDDESERDANTDPGFGSCTEA